MKKILFAINLLIFFCVPVFAETIILKSGKSVEAKIIEKTDEYIKVDVSGVPLKYYLDEIDTIDGNYLEAGLPLSSYSKKEIISTSEEEEDIRKILEMTGALKIGQQLLDVFNASMTQAIRSVRPDMPQEIFDITHEEIKKIIEEGMYLQGGYVDIVTKLYQKYYTPEEIKGLIKFYQSELGQKLIETTPAFFQESMAVGQLWAETLEPIVQQRVLERLKEKGVEITL